MISEPNRQPAALQGFIRAALLSSALLPAAALAQKGAPTEPSTPAATNTDAEAGINQVIVSARKREERAIDVPISLVVTDGETLTKKNILRMEDLTPYIPNFRQTNGATGTFRSIRGGGSPGSNFSFEQSTGLFFDNISYGRNVHSYVPFFDAQRVEVLRGPQVVTFGNSTTSGAVSVTTREPGDEFGGNLATTYEAENREVLLHGGVDVPLSDAFALRFSGYYQNLDRGWVDHIRPTSTTYGPRYSNYAGRIVGVARPSDSFTLKLKYEHDEIRTSGSSMQAVANPANDPNIVEAILDDRTFANQPAPYNVGDDFIHMDHDTALLELRYELGTHNLVSTSGYTRYDYSQQLDADVGPNPVSETGPGDSYEQFSQELRFSGPILDNLDYMAGVFFQHERQHAQFLFNNRLVFGRLAGLHTEADQWSVFASAAWKASSTVTLDVGARYSDIARTSDQYVIGTIPLTTTPLPTSPISPHDLQNIKTPDNFFMPQVVLSYQPTRNLNTFAKIVKGNKAGGVDSQYAAPAALANVASATFKAEEAKSYEVGFKSFLFEGSVSLDLAVFRTDYKDLQVNSFNLVTNSFEVRNAGTSVSQGVELDTSWTPRSGIRLNLSVGYLDAHYESFPQASCTPEQAAVVPAPCFNDLSGQPTPFNSKWTATAGAEYRFNAGTFHITPRVDVSTRSDYNPTTNNDPLLAQNGFTLLDARIDFAPADERYSVSLFGKNLTDKTYTEFVGGAPFLTGVRLGDTQRGRQVGVQASLTF
jgi:outer membrane receptor protein involved in Fe transport